MKRVWVLLLAVAFSAGCSTVNHVRVSSGSGVSVVGDASHVTVSGLRGGQEVTATMTSTDFRGVAWRSKTKVKADGDGQIVVDDVVLIGAMTPLDTHLEASYQWGVDSQSFQLDVAGARTTIRRQLSRRPVTRVRITADGLVGDYYTANYPGIHSAVLLVGGSDGGVPNELSSWVLAGEGHPVLALGYFGTGTLPSHLSSIPLEYFATALRWLATQRGVDAAHLVVDGASRGGEAALLIGATYPDLVHGVIAAVPSNVVLGQYPGCCGPAWTLQGQPVPYTHQFNNPNPTDEPGAVIKVERINGPVLLNCGGRDTVWSSCAYAQAVMTRLAHSRYPHQLQQCDTCDHFVSWGVPGEPAVRSDPGGMDDQDRLTYGAFVKATLALLQ